MRYTIWYHDQTEVDPQTSWTGLVPQLRGAHRENILRCKDQSTTDLFEYARPDAVIAANSAAIVSIEQTKMNPSGHNLPQRFSCFLKAAELGIPGIFFYPHKSRRTHSDPNVRYLNIRVPLAQFRLMEIYDVPSLSLFWPTAGNNLPSNERSAQANLAEVISEILDHFEHGHGLQMSSLGKCIGHQRALSEMDRVIGLYGTNRRYPPNPTVRRLMKNGFPRAKRGAAVAVDPPPKAQLMRTTELVKMLDRHATPHAHWSELRACLLSRDYSLLLTGTANHAGVDSEHPWPGYLSLLDVLYARRNGGKKATSRDVNLVYALNTVDSAKFAKQIARNTTAATIVYKLADAIDLRDGVLAGKPSGVNN